MRFVRLLPTMLFLLVFLAGVSAHGMPLLQDIPSVPHATAGVEDCLECHAGDALIPFPEDHEGRENDSCLGCHQPQTALILPPVPHPLEGRDDCLACHNLDGIRPFPEDHVGRSNEDCLVCHPVGEAGPEPTPEPTATLPPSLETLPTPIHEPVLFEDNTCIACHRELGGVSAEITGDWAESVHAERGVGCVSCHGGDPTQPEAEDAMSPEAGYLGPLPKERIPGLCGSCHSRVDLMRQFDLPTDQFAQYWQSQHGQALLEGDPNVATCFDCHDGHRVLRTGDPESRVYPLNEPPMCAGCHSDESLMAPYDIPTNQYDLYQDSVHGVALLQEQDLRAPTCSTCHGAHGAAPPGFQEVANVCGQCHSATEDYYLQGTHRFGMTSEAGPRCVTCHGRYDVPPATLDLFLGTEDRHCGSCHPPGSEVAPQVQAIYDALFEAGETYDQAESSIAQATALRLVMAEQEENLQQANTPLIEARALQHTVDVELVQAKTVSSIEVSREVLASVDEKLADLETRRTAMYISLAIILVTVVALVLVKRQLDQDLEARRARERGEAP
ncbi:MAG TPA: cytochrome c3 family protein [Anaerolineae bacterium]|nr:cytochrome c3 family protein [Anaerolineae bacterium]